MRKTLRLFSKFEIKLDRSSLNRKNYKDGITEGKEPETELTKMLRAKIQTIGPLSISTFMNECLVNPTYGYYYKERTDIFGSRGDFITSPEISELFGEMICIWCVSEWEKLGKPSSFDIIELGPGQGTLINDVLKKSKFFKQFHDSIHHINLVEVSPSLVKQQAKNLCNKENVELKLTEKMVYTADKVCWFKNLEDVPQGKPFILIAHEFFDALPVFQFQYKDPQGWREVLIDVDEDPKVPHHFKYVLAPGDSFASKALTQFLSAPMVKDTFAEISPAQLGVVEAIATRMERNGGSALIVDYGEDDNMGLTLQGIRRHQFVHELSSPGDVDLSVRVNFKDLRKRLEKFGKIKCSGVTRQDHFLHCLAIETRMAMLLSKPGDHEHLMKSYEKLVKDMGKVFKVMNMNSHGYQSEGFQILANKSM